MEMLEMTKERSEENFETMTTWAMVAIEFETATATKIPTAEVRLCSKAWQCMDTKACPQTKVETNDDNERNRRSS